MAENPMSARDVAIKQPKRPSPSRNMNTFGTPSEDATPRTIIQGILGAASVNQSSLNDLKKRPKLNKTPNKTPMEPPPQKRKSLRKSVGENDTPRTLIKNVLAEAVSETPLQIPHQTLVGDSLEEVKRQGKDINSPWKASNLNEDLENHINKAEKQAITEVDSLQDNADLLTSQLRNDLPMTHINDQHEVSERSDGTLQENNDMSSFYKSIDSIISSSNGKEVSDGNGTTTMATDKSINESSESKWKDLVTPCFPVTTRKVLHEANKMDLNMEKSRRKDSTKVSKRKHYSQIRKTPVARKSATCTNLPSNLVRSIFQHFSKGRVTKETFEIIEKGSILFFKQLSGDLMAYSRHAGRTTIEIRDVELLMKRQGYITPKQSLNSLIEKYLPMEYRQEIIPVAQSGNAILLKKKG